MKTETALEAPVAGEALDVLVGVGEQVVSGSALVALREAA